MKRVLYPGSFDPITLGHMDIIKRASGLFDEVIVLVLSNSQKNPLFSKDERVSMIKELTADLPNVIVDSCDGLMIDYARTHDAKMILRGLRVTKDFEYELQIAQVNHVQNPKLETVFLICSLEYAYLSSTVVKEFASYHSDISKFVPKSIIPMIEAKYPSVKGDSNGECN